MNPHEPMNNSWALEKEIGSPRILARGKDSLSGPGIIFDPSVRLFSFSWTLEIGSKMNHAWSDFLSAGIKYGLHVFPFFLLMKSPYAGIGKEINQSSLSSDLEG